MDLNEMLKDPRSRADFDRVVKQHEQRVTEERLEKERREQAHKDWLAQLERDRAETIANIEAIKRSGKPEALAALKKLHDELKAEGY